MHSHATADIDAQSLAAIQAEAHAWARKLATGRPTRRDGQAFVRWRAQSAAHEQAWRQACRHWQVLGVAARQYEAQHPDLAQQARAAPRPVQPRRRLLLGAAVPALGAMAAVALVKPPFGLWPSWTELGADLRTATGEQREVELAGVRLALNTRTSVALQSGRGHPRIELIAGEAAVSASGGAPCEVVAGSGHIRLDAGDIELRHLPSGQVRMRCNQGAAQLRHPARELALLASQEVLYDSHRLGEPTGLGQQGQGWRQGIVAFHDMPLAQAIEEINRYRPGRVVLLRGALAERRLSGRFAVDALDEAIVHIQKMYDAQVRRVADVVFLS
ncbi:DUF4880 domain-containing protein [Orrella sp. JC864]|uniref:FecR family protein n=1 Tax=Orrella sp. JC864 TaxID=3120298 RepID=UPI00300815C6